MTGLIADAFHRTGAVEIWGRGTNRVIDECKRHGIRDTQGAEIPFVMYSNGNEVFFWDSETYPPHKVHGFPTRDDLSHLRFLRAEEPDSGKHVWMTPGGGLEPGESRAAGRSSSLVFRLIYG